MPPVLLPLAQRLARAVLHRRGGRTRWVETPHGRIHAYDVAGRGDLPTTVLLHGLGSGALSFAPLIELLRADVRRVVAPEYPGHGFSPEPRSPLTPNSLMDAVARALDALVEEPALVVGSSLGGAVALRYAVTRPERVWGLVLVSPAGARSSEAELESLKRIFRMTSRAEAMAFVHRLYPRVPPLSGLFAHELPAMFARPAIVDFLAASGNDDAPPPEALAELRMPILLLWGKEEHLLPETYLAYFTQHLPAHTVIERPAGFGHCPHVDATAALARRIVAFAREVRGRVRVPGA